MTFKTMMIRGLLALTLAVGGAAACSDDDETTFELIGEWTGQFGDETITETDFNGSAIAVYDNALNFVVTQTPEDAMFNPGLYNRIVYTEPANDAFFYCTVDFGLDSVDAALTSTQTADASSPATGGCGMFSWTGLMRR